MANIIHLQYYTYPSRHRVTEQKEGRSIMAHNSCDNFKAAALISLVDFLPILKFKSK